MKGIYLTQEAKQEIEAEIAELKTFKRESSYTEDYINEGIVDGKIEIYKKILASAIVLLVEESWEDVIDVHDVEGACIKYYPQGVIIQPKEQ